MERFPPAVFGCHRYRGQSPGAIAPYPAWPEFMDADTFYTVPTLYHIPGVTNALYWPPHLYWAGDNEHSLGEFIPLLREDEGPAGEYATARGVASARPDGVWDAFALFHDAAHSFSFLLRRPVLRIIDEHAGALAELVRRSAAGAVPGFWDEFRRLNGNLVSAIHTGLAFEELRANMCGLESLAPELRRAIEPDVRSMLAADGSLDIVDRLMTLTSQRWEHAKELTYLAEAMAPHNPPAALADLQQSLMAQAASDWSDAQWTAWFADSEHNYLVLTGDILPKGDPMIGHTIGFRGQVDGSLALIHMPYTGQDDEADRDEYDPTIWPAIVVEGVMIESVRQQLAQLSGLECPFAASCVVCCGFGHYLRAIWEQIPERGRGRQFHPPHAMCLHYTVD